MRTSPLLEVENKGQLTKALFCTAVNLHCHCCHFHLFFALVISFIALFFIFVLISMIVIVFLFITSISRVVLLYLQICTARLKVVPNLLTKRALRPPIKRVEVKGWCRKVFKVQITRHQHFCWTQVQSLFKLTS